MANSITFRPSLEQNAFIESLVDAGDYHNQSEVIRDGLRLLQENRAQLAITQLRSQIDEGDQSGSPEIVDEEALLKQLHSEF